MSRIFGALFISATVTACGLGPATGGEGATLASPDKPLIARLSAEEMAVRANPNCGQAPNAFRPHLDDAIARLNSLGSVESFPLVSHTVSTEGIAVVICADRKIAAYTFPQTVVIHEGLLEALWGTAFLFGITDNTLRRASGVSLIGQGGRPVYTIAERIAYEADSSVAHNVSHKFASAVAFILYHELGHIRLGHLSPKSLQGGVDTPFAQEFAADAFAATTISATGYSLGGAEIAFALLSSVNPDSAVHPPSLTRKWRVIGAGDWQ